MLCTYIHPEILPEAAKVAASAVKAQADGTLESRCNVSISLAKKYGFLVCNAYLYWKNLYSQGRDTTVLLSNFINHPCPQMHSETARLLLEVFESI